LGVQIESSLTLKTQFKTLKQKAGYLYSNFFKFKPTVTGVKVKLELWKTYVKSIVEYGVESLALFPKKLDKFERFYYTTVKKAMGIPLTTNNKSLIKALGLMDIKRIIQMRFFKVYKKMMRRDLRVPEHVKSTAKGICDELGLGSLECTETEAFIRRCVEAGYESLYGENERPEDGNYPDGLYLVRETLGWPLLYTLIGKIVPEIKYKFSNCINCETVLTQTHLIDECPEYEAKRKATVETLRRFGVPLQETDSLEKLIKDIQIDPRLRKISKLGRQLVLHSIKTFTGELRTHFILKSSDKKEL